MHKSIALNSFALFLAVALIALVAVRAHASENAFAFSSESGESSSSYLGVDTRDISSDRLASLQLKEEKGVEVTMVDQDAPAGKAGLKEHDVILSVNGTEVESVEQLRRLIHEIPAGRTVSLSVSRSGQLLTVKAQLAERKAGVHMAWPQDNSFRVNIPPMPAIPAIPDMDVPVSIVIVHSSTRSGLMVENLTQQLGDFFGVKNGEGILVRSVEKGSRAETAGFHAGDVIVRVNSEKISDSGDFTRALNFRKGNSTSVTVLRDRKQLTLTLTLPDHGPTGLGLHESTNRPIGDARIKMDIIQAQSEIARLEPQIQCEIARNDAELQRAHRELQMRTADIKRIQPEMERATAAASAELTKRMKDLELQINQQNDVIRKSLERAFPNQADI